MDGIFGLNSVDQCYFSESSPSQYNFTTVSDGGPTGLTVDNLSPYTRYEAVVQAFNSKGAGPYSQRATVTTLQGSRY